MFLLFIFNLQRVEVVMHGFKVMLFSFLDPEF